MQLKYVPLFGTYQSGSAIDLIADPLGHTFFLFSLTGPEIETIRPQFRQVFSQTPISSALELHQLCQTVILAAQNAGLHLELAAGYFDFLGHRCSVCVQNGQILLKRAHKVGQIVQADEDLQIIEGKLQIDDVFVLVLKASVAVVKRMEQELPAAKTFLSIQHHLEEALLALPVSPTMAQAGLVGLSVTEGDQSEPPIFAGQLLATGEMIQTPMTEATEATEVMTSSAIPSLPIVIWQFLRSLGSKDVYVRRRATRKFISLLFPGFLGLILIIALVVVQSQQRAKQAQRAQAMIQPIEAQLTQIRQLVNTDPLTARQQTEAVIVQLDGEIKQQASYKTTVALLQTELNQVKAYYGSISGLEQYPALQTFYDLRLVKSDLVVNRMDLQDNTLVFLDSGQGKVIALDTNSKQWTDIPVGNAAQMKDIELSGNTAVIFGNGLYRINLANAQDNTLLRANDDLLQNATGMRLYQQYIYLVSIAQNNIFRYVPDPKNPNQLADPAGWLHTPVTFDLNQLQSFAIDGDVWIGTKTGEIKKFTSGVAADFTITGLTEPFSTPITIYTKDSQANLYVLEPAKERLDILSKSGTFLREIKSPTFSTTTNVVADEKSKKAYVISGALVFQIDL